MQRTTQVPVHKLPQQPGLGGWLLGALGHEARCWRIALADWRLWICLAVATLLLALATQAPLRYRVAVGQEDGPGADLPLLLRFNTPERDDHGRFRWTAERSIIQLPGLGRRGAELRLTVFPVGPEVARIGPKVVELWSSQGLLATLPVRPEGALYRLSLPAAVVASGRLELRNATFSPQGDPRSLGVPLARLEVFSLGSGLVGPSPALLAGWALALALAWALLRRCGVAAATALPLVLALAGLLALALLADAPRTALGVRPAVETLMLCYLLALTLLAALPPLARRLAVRLDARTLAWLTVLAVLVAGLRYGGKIYPFAMPGDIGFHTNRFNDVVVRGQFILYIPHRGITLPYPPTFYMLLAPLRLSGLPVESLLRGGQAVLDALSLPLMYAIVARGWGLLGLRARPAVGLGAAAIYGLTPAGFMASWWNFSTFIYAQWALLVVVLTLLLAWPALCSLQPPARRSQSLFVVVIMLFLLSHSTAPLNMLLLAALGMVLLLLRWNLPWARLALVRLTLALAVAGSVAFAIFYSNYLALFVEQFALLASGGLTGLANREPVGRDVLWRTLWHDGLIMHYGFFPLPLALIGLGILAPHARQGSPRTLLLPLLLALTFLLMAGFALLPFISGSTLATRYLMFGGWAIAAAASLTLNLFWRTGRAGRIVTLAVGSFALWLTLAQWVAALAWRLRPPEPF